MLPDRVSNPGPLTYESGALPIAKVYYGISIRLFPFYLTFNYRMLLFPPKFEAFLLKYQKMILISDGKMRGINFKRNSWL